MRNPAAATVFRRLHESGLLILPNAWDAGTARLIESLGAKAIATTSAGVAWCHGYPDGDAVPPRLVAATVSEIARVVSVPVSADIEGGYSDDPAAVAEAVSLVVDAGAVGINIEDARKPADLLCRKIEAAVSAARQAGVELFVNARTDVYLRTLVKPERRVEEALARAERYRGAGASGIFVPGIKTPEDIRAFTSAARLPLHVMATRGLPRAAELEALGVRRVSSGADLAEWTYARIAALARDFLETGFSDPLGEGVMPYPDINALFPRASAQ
jgi:2-methylisocitrate lyase-like PEP mutase family enzyme